MIDPELLAYWRPIQRALDPRRVMQASEVRALYTERSDAPSDDIALRLLAEGALSIELLDPDSFTKLILCGSRGSGKTTELTRLGHQLRAQFCVIQLDLAAALPERTSTLPIVVLFGLAALRALEQWTGPEEVRAAVDQRRDALGAALARFAKTGSAVAWVGEWMSAIGAVVVSIPSTTAQAVGGALAVGGKGAASAGEVMQSAQGLKHAAGVLQDIGRGPLGETLDSETQQDARAVIDAVNQILVALAEAAGRPPLLLADGLDKRTELAEVLAVLADSRVLTALAAPVVLTGPVNLRHDARFNSLRGHFATEVLYNIAVRRPPSGDADGEINPEAIAIFETILERRVRNDGLPEGLFSAANIERMAVKSSGIVRDFLTLLHSATLKALRAGRRTTIDADVTEAIRDFRRKLQLPLKTDSLKQLRRVLKTGMLSGEKAADQLLFENYIACYPNGDIWFRPHEVLVDFVRRKGDE